MNSRRLMYVRSGVISEEGISGLFIISMALIKDPAPLFYSHRPREYFGGSHFGPPQAWEVRRSNVPGSVTAVPSPSLRLARAPLLLTPLGLGTPRSSALPLGDNSAKSLYLKRFKCDVA